ncbi:WD40/YVTN/BNR-like repeat-containing protein [Pseudomonas putida]
MGSLKQFALVLLCSMLMLLQGGAQAAGYVDVLDLPAKESPLAVSSPLVGIVRAGDRLVAVGQRGHILYSDNGGTRWSQASVPVSSDLNAVFFSSSRQGWAVGNDGVVLHSDDAGQTWSKQLDGRQIGALVVRHYTQLMQAEPGNEQWPLLVEEGQRLVEQGADKPLLDVWFANDKLGYVVGVFNLILRTEDGGKTWAPFQDRTDNLQGFHLYAMAWTGDALYIAGEQGLLLKWDDSLQRFHALQTPYHGSYFGVVGKPGEVLVYGLRGNALRSTDGGVNWSPVHTGLQVNISKAIADSHGVYRFFSQAEQPSVVGAALAADGSLVVVGSRGAHALATE